MVANEIYKSKSGKLIGYEVEQKNMDELKSENSILKAEIKQKVLEIEQKVLEIKEKDLEIERLNRIIAENNILI